MKVNVTILIALLLNAGCAHIDSQKKEFSNNDITIRYAGFGASTPLSVSCDLFGRLVFSKNDTILISDTSGEHLVLEKLFKQFTVDSSIVGIDTRIKIGYLTDTICLDKFGNYYFKNRDKYMRNDSLSTFIYKKINWDISL